MLPGSSGLTALTGGGNVALAKSPTRLQFLPRQENRDARIPPAPTELH